MVWFAFVNSNYIKDNEILVLNIFFCEIFYFFLNKENKSKRLLFFTHFKLNVLKTLIYMVDSKILKDNIWILIPVWYPRRHFQSEYVFFISLLQSDLPPNSLNTFFMSQKCPLSRILFYIASTVFLMALEFLTFFTLLYDLSNIFSFYFNEGINYL